MRAPMSQASVPPARPRGLRFALLAHPSVQGVRFLPKLAMPWFFANNPDVGELPPNMRPTPEQLVGLAFGFGLSILLLVSGILTLRRRPVGRLLHLLYAGLSVPLVAVNSYMQWKQMALMEQWLRENPNSPFAAGQSSTGNMIGLVFGIFFGLAYPLFLLVWFGLVKRSAASMGQNESETVI